MLLVFVLCSEAGAILEYTSISTVSCVLSSVTKRNVVIIQHKLSLKPWNKGQRLYFYASAKQHSDMLVLS